MLSRSRAGVLAGVISLAAMLGCGESEEEVLARKVLDTERRLSQAQADLHVAFVVAFVAVIVALLFLQLALSERRQRKALSDLSEWFRRRRPR
jgi:hypothetical protein